MREDRATLVLALLGAACGEGAPAADASPCDPVTMTVPPAQGVHIPTTEIPEYTTNPPASGPHYPIWARWARVYEQPIPRGYYVHNQEHGGVTILYNCPEGCPELVAELTAVAASLPAETACTPPISGRWLVTPDPLLPPGVTVAAGSWSAIYTATCVDAPTLTRFYNAHVGHAPEDTCGDGQYTPPLTDAGPSADAAPADAAP